MENRKTYQDVPVKDKIYRINKMDARSACWLFAFLADKAEGKALLSALGKCSKKEFDEIQSMALRQIEFMDYKDGNTFPTAVTTGNGSICDITMQEDPSVVFNLTAECIMFNLTPFLVDVA